MEAVAHHPKTLSSSGIIFEDPNSIGQKILALMRDLKAGNKSPETVCAELTGKYSISDIQGAVKIECTPEEKALFDNFITLIETQEAAINAIASSSTSKDTRPLDGRVTAPPPENTQKQDSESKSTPSSGSTVITGDEANPDKPPAAPEEPPFYIKHKNTIYKAVKVGGMITAFVLIVLTYKKA